MNVITGHFWKERIKNPNTDEYNIARWDFWDNVTILSSNPSSSIEESWVIENFESEISAIIDDLILSWVNKFESEYWIDTEFSSELSRLWNEIHLKATWIDLGLSYLNDDEDWEVSVDDFYILEAIKNQLEPYKIVIFKLLERENRNNKK